MKSIALFINDKKPDAVKLVKEVIDFGKKHRVKIYQPGNHSLKKKHIDLILSLGGDGTILKIYAQHPNLSAPLLGINLGGLGFMAEVCKEEMLSALTTWLEGNFSVEERMMMKVSVGKRCFHVINDIVLHRGSNPHLVHITVHVDDVYLNTFSADGIVVATPTGSTAYSLSCGGPIVTPNVSAFIFSPICPHTITQRPIVLMPRKSMTLTCVDLSTQLSCDGRAPLNIPAGHILTLTRSSKVFSLVQLKPSFFYETLRHKLGWIGRLTNKSEKF